MYLCENNNYFHRKSLIKFSDNSLFEPIFCSLSFLKVKLSSEYKPHRHKAFEIIIPTKQNYNCVLNGKNITVFTGQLLLVQPDNLHKDNFCVGQEYIAINFKVSSIDHINQVNELFRNNISPQMQICTISKDNEIENILSILTSFDVNGYEYVFQFADSLFKAFFWKLISLYPPNNISTIFNKTSESNLFEKRLINLFEKRIRVKLNLSEMAKTLGMSESSLSHKTKKILGLSPARAFMKYKMQRAAILLQGNHMNIKEVSDILGFKDQFHFSKCFKRYHKSPPSEHST